MKNWLEQEIDVDTVVYRGAREFDSSSFKVGRVLKVDPAKRTVRVHWLFRPGSTSVYTSEQASTVGVDTVVALPDEVWSLLEGKVNK